MSTLWPLVVFIMLDTILPWLFAAMEGATGWLKIIFSLLFFTIWLLWRVCVLCGVAANWLNLGSPPLGIPINGLLEAGLW